MFTMENINKYFSESEEAANGNLNHQKGGVQSTKKTACEHKVVDTISETSKKERDIYAKVIGLWNEKRNHLYSPNRKIPNHLEKWQQVHHGDGSH